MLSDSAIDDPDDDLEHRTERIAYWWTCGACEDTHETEFDERGSVVECPSCGARAVLTGAY